MSTRFSIKINQEDVQVASRHNTGKGKVEITVLNPLVLLLPKHIPLDNDNSAQGISTIGDLHIALSQQTLNKEYSPAIAILYKDRTIDYRKHCSFYKMAQIKDLSDRFEETINNLKNENE